MYRLRVGKSRLFFDPDTRDTIHCVDNDYRYGISQSRYRVHYEEWLAGLLSAYQLLSIDEGTAAQYAAIRVELVRIPSNDTWIAALARQHAMPVISQDTHFDLVPKLKRLGWRLLIAQRYDRVDVGSPARG